MNDPIRQPGTVICMSTIILHIFLRQKLGKYTSQPNILKKFDQQEDNKFTSDFIITCLNALISNEIMFENNSYFLLAEKYYIKLNEYFKDVRLTIN